MIELMKWKIVNTDKKGKQEEVNLAVNQPATKVKSDECEQETHMINVNQEFYYNDSDYSNDTAEKTLLLILGLGSQTVLFHSY